MKSYYVYIITNKLYGVLYIGVTNDIIRRMYEHKNGLVPGFSKQYCLHRLVYMEETTDINAPIQREKNLNRWSRQSKIELIAQYNPEWRDLAEELNVNHDQTIIA